MNGRSRALPACLSSPSGAYVSRRHRRLRGGGGGPVGAALGAGPGHWHGVPRRRPRGRRIGSRRRASPGVLRPARGAARGRFAHARERGDRRLAHRTGSRVPPAAGPGGEGRPRRPPPRRAATGSGPHAGRCPAPRARGRAGRERHRGRPRGQRLGRRARRAGDQGPRGHRLRAGPALGRAPGHAGRRDRHGVRRPRHRAGRDPGRAARRRPWHARPRAAARRAGLGPPARGRPRREAHPDHRAGRSRGRLLRVPAEHRDAPDPAAHAARQGRHRARLPRPAPRAPGRGRRALPRPARHRHPVLPRSGGVRRPPPPRLPEAPREAPGALSDRRAHPRLGARVLDGGGGVLPRDRPAGGRGGAARRRALPESSGRT